jgi:hypothetical protein
VPRLKNNYIHPEIIAVYLYIITVRQKTPTDQIFKVAEYINKLCTVGEWASATAFVSHYSAYLRLNSKSEVHDGKGRKKSKAPGSKKKRKEKAQDLICQV